MAGSNVVPLRMKRIKAQEIVRRRAADTSNIILSNHAKERMFERDIWAIDVFRILRNGVIEEEPQKTDRGEWKVKVCMRLKGNRDAGVITIILDRQRLLVKTVEWEDL
ncbi:MAG: DUF4258 domain-containing protein [Ktedonobacteraceae bacterium]